MFKRTHLALIALFMATPMTALAQTNDTSLIVLPFQGDDDAEDALDIGIRIFEARISATGNFSFVGDQETDSAFQDSRQNSGVSPTDLREAQLVAAGRTYADWAVEVSIEEVGRDEYIVSLNLWDPDTNMRLFSDTEIVDDTSSMSAAARLGLDELAQRFLTSPIVMGLDDTAVGDGRLDVLRIEPDGARMLVNGVDVGSVPNQFSNLPTGTVNVEIVAEGYETVSRRMNLSSSDVSVLDGITLIPSDVEIEIRCNIEGASIEIDGEVVATTERGDWVEFDVPATARTLRILADGYGAYSTRLSLIGSSTRRFEVNLNEADGPDGVDVTTSDCSRVHEVTRARLCMVPAGDFTMGVNDSPRDDAGPAREVTIDHDIFVFESEVTVAMYRECVESGGCTEPNFEVRGDEVNTARSNEIAESCNYGASGHDEHPMNCINWHGAVQFCEWSGGDLPTEAIWEHAARGSDGRSLPWAFEDTTLSCTEAESGMCGGATSEVGDRPAGRSPYGLHDMSGSVAEWTLDTYEAGAYRTLPDVNPYSDTSTSRRVVRGGSYLDFAENLLTYARARMNTNARAAHIGFRCIVD